jgi:acetylornithine/N-succinyldiaminopimelate aminotransferase
MSDLRQNADAHHILDRDSETLIPVYARYPIVMDYGQGMYLYDTSGNRYLDLMGGLGVNALGHAHPRMVAAMADQAGKLVHLSPQYANRHVVELAERLCALSGLKGVFYSTGGAEAVEGALKLARTHARQNFSHAKQGIVALKKSYHGRTYGSMSVTGQEKYRLDFGPGIPHVSFVDRNSLEELRATVNDSTAAILLEPLLGEGGVYEVSAAFLREARALADKHNALLIFDEIQCGLGRTGAWFNYTRSGIEPDILILGKPLGGGIPLSALLVNDKLFHSFGRSSKTRACCSRLPRPALTCARSSTGSPPKAPSPSRRAAPACCSAWNSPNPRAPSPRPHSPRASCSTRSRAMSCAFCHPSCSRSIKLTKRSM